MNIYIYITFGWLHFCNYSPNTSAIPPPQNHTGLRGLHVWPWEVAVTYVDLLTGVVINGATSSLRKAALVGVRAGEGGDYVNGGGGGLIALTKFGQLLQTGETNGDVM